MLGTPVCRGYGWKVTGTQQFVAVAAGKQNCHLAALDQTTWRRTFPERSLKLVEK